MIQGFNSTVGLIYTITVSIDALDKAMFQFHCWSDLYLKNWWYYAFFWCFNSTVGLIYTPDFDSVIPDLKSFQFHCWSDLYYPKRRIGETIKLFQFHCWSDLYGRKKFTVKWEKKFQFHCWSDLYTGNVLLNKSIKTVSIPLLV